VVVEKGPNRSFGEFPSATLESVKDGDHLHLIPRMFCQKSAQSEPILLSKQPVSPITPLTCIHVYNPRKNADRNSRIPKLMS
jgi:hypothetical protein